MPPRGSPNCARHERALRRQPCRHAASSSWFIAATIGCNSVGACAACSGRRSSACRAPSSPVSARIGASARRTPQAIASSSTGSTSNQGSSWLLTRLRAHSRRAPAC
jgi:hypothetical protein